MVSRRCLVFAALSASLLLASSGLHAAPLDDWSAPRREDDFRGEPVRPVRPRYGSAVSSRPEARYDRGQAMPASRAAYTEEVPGPPMVYQDAGPPPPPYADPMMDGFGPDAYGPVPAYGCDGGCCGPCFNRCGGCGRGPIYARGEYLLWWLKGDGVPPLVTTSPSGTPQASAGVLGQPNTTVLFGNQNLNDAARSGGRVVVGTWLGPNSRLQGEFFILGQQTASFNQTSTGNPILARPFFNLSTGLQDSNVIAYPNVSQGTISASETSSFLVPGFTRRGTCCASTDAAIAISVSTPCSAIATCT